MPLVSQHFRLDPKLQKTLISDPDHVIPGSRGPHVSRIQEALMRLGEGLISRTEIVGGAYGLSTTRSVVLFKTRHKILNYENKIDPIVGRKTIAKLDRDMEELERAAHAQSLLVAEDYLGSPHDHSLCPELEDSDLHIATPINPNGWGRKINIYGSHETDYLGFEDYAVDPNWRKRVATGTLRKMTWAPIVEGGLPDKSVSDIAMRSSPVTDAAWSRANGGKKNLVEEVARVAMPGCRFTFAGNEAEFVKLRILGPVIEYVEIPASKSKYTSKLTPTRIWVLVVLG